MPTSESQSRSGSRAVERAVAVLGCFDDGAAELTVSSLAARTGLPVSSAHRIAQPLVRGGLLKWVSRPGTTTGMCFSAPPFTTGVKTYGARGSPVLDGDGFAC